MLLAGSVRGQGAPPTGKASVPRVKAGRSPDYGVSGMTVWTASALESQPFLPAMEWWNTIGKAGRYLVSADGILSVPVHLPQGALIRALEIEACGTPDSLITLDLYGMPAPGGMDQLIAELSPEFVEQGCAFFQKPLDIPVVVDNQNNQYFFGFQNTPGDGSTYFSAVRVYYQLQVSPAPATATFNDVPVGNPYFQFVEALAASGVSAGCGSGNYCPDAPVTRGQMAVFLAKALGLYWAN
jgi:hypothetical protein